MPTNYPSPRRAAPVLPAPDEEDEDVQAPVQQPGPRTGTTGGLIPTQAGTWDRAPAPRLSADPGERAQQSVAQAQSDFAAKQLQDNPFLFSNDIKSLAKEGGRQYTQAAIAQGNREYRQQVISDRKQAIAERNDYNSRVLADYEGRGVRHYIDPANGKIVPVIDEKGRTLFHKTDPEEVISDKTGFPMMRHRNEFGQGIFTELPIVHDPGNPKDPNLYYKRKDGTLFLDKPAVSIQEGMASNNYPLKRTALAANKRRVEAVHREALAPMKEELDGLDAEYKQAQGTRDILNQRIIQANNQLADTDDPAQIDALNASVSQLKDQLSKVDEQINGKKGSLTEKLNAARRGYDIGRKRMIRDVYQAQINERKAILSREGGDPATDKNLQFQQGMLDTINKSLGDDEGEQAPQQRPVSKAQGPLSAPTASPLELTEPAALKAQGVKSVGGVGIDEIAQRYGNAATPASLLAINQRVNELDDTLNASQKPQGAIGRTVNPSEATQISQKLRNSMQAERDYLSSLYTQRFARLPQDQQAAVNDTLEKMKPGSAAGAFARSAGTGVLPAVGAWQGFELGAAAGAPLAGQTKGIAPLVTGALGAFVGSTLADKVQRAALNKVAPDTAKELERLQALDAEGHPVAAAAGNLASNLPVFKANPLMAARGLAALAKIARGVAVNAEEKAAAKILALQGGFATGVAVGQPLLEGRKPTVGDVTQGVAQMMLFGEPRMGGKGGAPKAGGKLTPEQAAAEFDRQAAEANTPQAEAAQPVPPQQQIEQAVGLNRQGEVPSAAESAAAIDAGLSNEGIPPAAKSAAESAGVFGEAERQQADQQAAAQRQAATVEQSIQSLVDELSGGNDAERNRLLSFRQNRGLSSEQFLEALQGVADYRRNPSGQPDVVAQDVQREVDARANAPINGETPGVTNVGRIIPAELEAQADLRATDQAQRVARAMAEVGGNEAYRPELPEQQPILRDEPPTPAAESAAALESGISEEERLRRSGVGSNKLALDLQRRQALSNENRPVPESVPDESARATAEVPAGEPQQAAPDVSAREEVAAGRPPVVEQSPEAVAADRKKYDVLQKRLSNLLKKGGAEAVRSPEYQAAWQQSEDIKNRHGGMPPGEVSGESAPKETIRSSAVRTTDGQIVEGKVHGDAFNAARDRGLEVGANADDEGFVTSSGRYVDRQEAMRIAKAANQVDPESILASQAMNEGLYQKYRGDMSKLTPSERKRLMSASSLLQEHLSDASTQGEPNASNIQSPASVGEQPERLQGTRGEGSPRVEPSQQGAEPPRAQAAEVGRDESVSGKVEPTAELRKNNAGIDLPPVSSLSAEKKLAELKEGGITTYNGKPIEDANPAQLSNALGKFRRGELTPEGEKPSSTEPRTSDKIIDALQKMKRNKGIPGATSFVDPNGGEAKTPEQRMRDAAHDAALDLAILGVRAGRALADIIKVAVARLKAKFPGATDADVARLTDAITEAHGAAQEPKKKETASLTDRLADAWKNFKSEQDLKQVISANRDAVEGVANKEAVEKRNEVRDAIERAEPDEKQRPVAEQALGFYIEANDGKDLAAMRKKIEDSDKASPKWKERALAAIDYAEANGDKLKDAAERYRRITDEQLAAEQDIGMPTLEAKNYVPRYQDVEDGSWLEPKKGGSPTGASNRKNRSFETLADSISAGIDPKTINAVDALANRVKAGMTGVNLRAWQKALFDTKAPSGESVAVKPERVARADGSYYYQAPKGYELETLANTPVAVHKDYAGLVGALTNPSWWGKNKATVLAQKANANAKAMTLAVDTFHLGRLAFRSAMINASHPEGFKLGPSYKQGLLLADHSPAEIKRMADAGEIPKENLPQYLEDKAILDRMVNVGYNIGQVSDALHQEMVQSLPVLGQVNKFIFQQFQRGAMSDAAVLEFKRQKADNPDLSDDQVARKVSKELLTRFGNLGRQGMFKSKGWQDTARMLFLAPQWNEGLIRSELGGVKQIAEAAKNTLTGKKAAMGLLGREMLTTGISLFAASQIINQVTRGKFTWENPEEGWGAKLSAWIPDKLGGSSGFFLNPMGLTAETGHLLLNSFERAGNTYDPIISYLRSRASATTRPLWTFLTGKDALGRTLKPDQRWSETAKDALPAPISGGSALRVAKGLATGGKAEKFPGEFQKQAMQTFGLRTDKAPSPEGRIQNLAHDFNEKRGAGAPPATEVSDFQELTDAVRRGNEDDVKDAIETLLEKRGADDLEKYYRQYQRRPFTGSYKTEADFLRTLNSEQRQQYAKARAERQRLGALALRAISRIPPKQRAGPYAAVNR